MSKQSVIETESMRNVFGEELLQLSLTFPDVYVLDGDLATSTKINAVEDHNPGKFLQMGIAEQNMVGVAAGMATIGLKPWLASFATFVTKRALDQIQVVVAQPNLNVNMVGAYAGLLNGKAGKTHQSLEDLAIMRSLVNVVVLAPADGNEVRQVMQFANEYNGPVYMRLARDPVPSIMERDYQFQLGKGVFLHEGTDITIISTGTQSAGALRAAKELDQEGISAAVLHMPSIKPLDVEAIIRVADQTGAIVTSEEHSIYGGLGSAVAEVLVEHCPVPMKRIGVQDRNAQSGTNEELLDDYRLSDKWVKKAVKDVLQRKVR